MSQDFVQRQPRNVQKSIMHVQGYSFADINLFLFAVFVDVAVIVAKFPIAVIQKFYYHGNMTSHFCSLLDLFYLPLTPLCCLEKEP